MASANAIPRWEPIFEPFFTTKRDGEGTGLGLPAVRAAVKDARGFLLVETAPDVGTCFEVYLPALDAASAT